MDYAEMYPRTLDAVGRLLETMSEADKDVLKSIQEEELVIYNGSWGAAIRNSFGLWSDNAALLESTGTSHPDDASLVIIQTLWSELRRETPSAGSPVKTGRAGRCGPGGRQASRYGCRSWDSRFLMVAPRDAFGSWDCRFYRALETDRVTRC